MQVGSDGVLTIEHDYDWTESPDLARRGLVASLRPSRQYVV